MRARLFAGPCAALLLVGSADAQALEQRSERGPVEVLVTLSPDEPVIGDPIVLELEARAEEGVELLMPEFGEALDRFRILDFAPREEIDAEGRVVSRQRYTLQAPMSGQHAIPPLLVEFVDRRAGQKVAPEGADAYEVLTERLEFEVASVLPAGAVPDLRPPPGELSPRTQGGLSVAIWLAIAGAAALVAAPFAVRIFLAWRARARRRSAWDVARGELDDLLMRGRPRPGEVGAYYVELSGIVRRYLENRFELRSPELTTEEFLVVASRSPDLTPGLRSLLGDFLSTADLVKFAGHRPGAEEIDDSLEAAGRFLEETRIPDDVRRSPASAPAEGLRGAARA